MALNIALDPSQFVQMMSYVDINLFYDISKEGREFLYVHDLGPRSRNDLDLQYSHSFINLIRCLLLPTFRSLAATVSEKSTRLSQDQMIFLNLTGVMQLYIKYIMT